MERTEERLRRYIRDELVSIPIPGELTDDYQLIEKGVIDSMGIFQLVSFIETEFQVQIADEELVLDNFASIDGIARLIESKRIT